MTKRCDMIKWLQYLCFVGFLLFFTSGATAGPVSNAGYELGPDGLWYRGGIGYERYLSTAVDEFGEEYAAWRYRGVAESITANTPDWRAKLLEIVERDRLEAARIEREQAEATAFQRALELLQPQAYSDGYGQGQGGYGLGGYGDGGYGGYVPNADQGTTVFGYSGNSYSMIAQLYDRNVPLVLAHSLAAAQSRSDKLSSKLADKQSSLLDNYAEILRIIAGDAPATDPVPEQPPRQTPQDDQLTALEVISSRCAECHNAAKRSGKGSDLFPDGLDLTKWADYTLDERAFVRDVVDSGRMPPGHDPLTEAERLAFHLP